MRPQPNALLTWLTAMALLLFSAFLALLILATAMPFPDLGWNRSTAWGRVPASAPGIVLCLAVIGAAFAAAVTRRAAWAVLAVPALLTLILRPDPLALDVDIMRSTLAMEREAGRNASLRQTANLNSLLVDDLTIAAFIAERRARVEASQGALRGFASAAFPTVADVDAAEAAIAAHQKARMAKAAEIAAVEPAYRRSLVESELTHLDCLTIDGMAERPFIDDLDRPQRSRRANRVCLPPLTFSQATLDSLGAPLKKEHAQLTNQIAAQLSVIDAAAHVSDTAVGRAPGWFSSAAIATTTLVAVALAALLIAEAWTLPAMTGAALGFALLASRSDWTSAAVPSWTFVAANTAMPLAIFLSARVVRLFRHDNASLWRMMSARGRGRILLVSLLWWLPLGVIATLGLAGGRMLDDALVESAYRRKAEVPLTSTRQGCENPEGLMIIPADKEHHNLENDLDNTARCRFDEIRQAAITVADSDTAAPIADARAWAIGRFDAVFRPSLSCVAGRYDPPDDQCLSHSFDYPHCHWMNFKCRAEVYPDQKAQGIYVNDLRAPGRTRFITKVEALTKQGTALTEDAKDGIRAAAIEEVDAVEMAFRDALSASVRAWNLVNLATVTLFVVAVLKSFGYVLGRVVHAQPADWAATSEATDVEQTHDDIRKGEISYEIDPAQVHISADSSFRLEAPGSYYIALRQEASGVSTHGPWFPRPWSLPVARFPFQYLFSWVRIKQGSQARLSTTNGRHFVAIELEDGQRIAFDLSRLYAFSATVRLGGKWNFGFANLLRGRTRLIVAEGPGTLCLRSRGKPALLGSGPEHEHVPVARILAWSEGAFEVDSHLGVADIYLGNVVVRPAPGTLAVADAEAPARLFPGGLRFIPMLLLPT